MEATGVLAVGETTAALGYVKGRKGLSPRWTMVILLICATAVGLPAGAWASGSWWAALISIECALLGLLVGVLIVKALTRPMTRAALGKRRQAYEQPLTLRLTPEALVYDLAELTMIARWACVTDVYRARGHWVFLVQSSAVALPRRFFASPQTEYAFIAEAVSRMTQEAVARSPDATGFLRNHAPNAAGAA